MDGAREVSPSLAMSPHIFSTRCRVTEATLTTRNIQVQKRDMPIPIDWLSSELMKVVMSDVPVSNIVMEQIVSIMNGVARMAVAGLIMRMFITSKKGANIIISISKLCTDGSRKSRYRPPVNVDSVM